MDDSPAALGGLRPEDLIVALDGEEVGGVDDIQRLMTAERIGETVTATVVRQEHELLVPLVPVELEDAG